MNNITKWQPTKIKYQGDKFCVNQSGVAPGSLYYTLEDFRAIDSVKTYLKGHLVDLGCGNVPYYQWYKDRVEQITCVDWSKGTHDDSFVDVFADLNQSLPLADRSVDSVFSTSVLEHICEPLVLLREIARILKPNGYVILSVPFTYPLHEEPFDYYRYTPYSLQHLADKAGLKVVCLKHCGSGFGVLVDVTARIGQTLMGTVSRLMPKYVGLLINKLGTVLLRLFQRTCYEILKQKQVLQIIDRANLSGKIALGYVVVLQAPDPDESMPS